MMSRDVCQLHHRLLLFISTICTFKVLEQCLIAVLANENHFQKQMISDKLITITDNEAKVGYITSPNYPNPFPNNSSSFVSLIINHDPTLDTIKLTFEDVSLQTSNFCDSEGIEILLPTNQSSPTNSLQTVYLLCGTLIPQPLIINSRSLSIHLVSDAFSSGKSRGFLMKFEFLNHISKLYNGCGRMNQFRCRNRQCIPNDLRCNRHDDCGDASDEDILTPCLNLPTIPYSINYQCGIVPEISGFNDLTFNKVREKQSLLINSIVGGEKSSTRHPRRWPFQVSIQMNRIEPISHICGGTLIHPMFVLSASHCFKSLIATADYKFVFGSQDLRIHLGAEIHKNIQIRYANSISLYPGGNSLLEELGIRQYDFFNDLALIELNAPVELTPHVWPICLPHLGESIVAGRECLSSGFGDTRGTGNPYLLKHATQIVYHSSECHSNYSDFDVDDYTMICVKNQHSNGPCNGDSGGPMFCSNQNSNAESPPSPEQAPPQRLYKPDEIIAYLPISDEKTISVSRVSPSFKSVDQMKYTVFGVTSFTTDGNIGGGFCGLDKVPTIYVRVSTKVEWILSQLKINIHDLSKEDIQQDQNNRSALFGYMFRSGLSRHKDFTPKMTITQ